MINAVTKATKILDAVSENRNLPISLGEISRITNINKSTCSHIVSTLVAENYLKRVSHTEGYIIGPAVYCLSRFGKYENDLSSICHPVLKWLNKETGFGTLFAVIEGTQKFIIDYVDPSKIPGNVLPDDVYRTATGRAILFNMTKSEILDFFEKSGPPQKNYWEGINSAEDILAAASKYKKTDILLSEMTIDDKFYRGYGTAVFKNRTCIGAIGVSTVYNKNQLDFLSADEEKIKSALIKARKEINRRVGFL